MLHKKKLFQFSCFCQANQLLALQSSRKAIATWLGMLKKKTFSVFSVFMTFVMSVSKYEVLELVRYHKLNLFDKRNFLILIFYHFKIIYHFSSASTCPHRILEILVWGIHRKKEKKNSGICFIPFIQSFNGVLTPPMMEKISFEKVQKKFGSSSSSWINFLNF